MIPKEYARHLHCFPPGAVISWTDFTNCTLTGLLTCASNNKLTFYILSVNSSQFFLRFFIRPRSVVTDTVYIVNSHLLWLLFRPFSLLWAKWNLYVVFPCENVKDIYYCSLLLSVIYCWQMVFLWTIGCSYLVFPMV